ncbi:UBE2B [Cordylochernes scorpioides]|uniref:UBE2B n=1 Tax=Cordylochernes scorpioides TaxID=51811 RepID=A0ABY6KVY0_9ARAC|nr:UBE2B [Cordylochernes scorpioides]
MEAFAADSNMSTDAAPSYPWSGTIAEVHQLASQNNQQRNVWCRLQEDPPAGISGAPTDNNILLWNAVIFG